MGKSFYRGIVAILLAFAIMAGGATAMTDTKAEAAATSSYKYTLYIGLNDQKTNKQEITTYTAMDIVEETCLKYLDGVTVMPATGMCLNFNGQRVHENTIVCFFYDADETAIHNIAKDLIAKLNQSNILIEKTAVFRDYYTGK